MTIITKYKDFESDSIENLPEKPNRHTDEYPKKEIKREVIKPNHKSDDRSNVPSQAKAATIPDWKTY